MERFGNLGRQFVFGYIFSCGFVITALAETAGALPITAANRLEKNGVTIGYPDGWGPLAEELAVWVDVYLSKRNAGPPEDFRELYRNMLQPAAASVPGGGAGDSETAIPWFEQIKDMSTVLDVIEEIIGEDFRARLLEYSEPPPEPVSR